MRLLIDKLRTSETARSLMAAWTSLQASLRRLAAHERKAVGSHIDAVHARATVARQAGDASTLIRDQIDLLPESRARVRDNVTAVRAILGELLADWASICDDWLRRRRDGRRDDR